MKYTVTFLFAVTALAGTTSAYTQSFELRCADMAAGAPIAEKFVFNGFGCTGGNISPALNWNNVPLAQKALP